MARSNPISSAQPKSAQPQNDPEQQEESSLVALLLRCSDGLLPWQWQTSTQEHARVLSRHAHNQASAAAVFGVDGSSARATEPGALNVMLTRPTL